MDLSEFTTSLTTPEDGYSQFLQTKTGGRKHSIIGNEQKTENLLATFFWQIFISNDLIRRDSEEIFKQVNDEVGAFMGTTQTGTRSTEKSTGLRELKAFKIY